MRDEHRGDQCWCEGDLTLHSSLDALDVFEAETWRLLLDYKGDEGYPDDDHSLGLHVEPDIKCRSCREEYI